VQPGLAAVTAQKRGHRRAQNALIDTIDAGIGRNEGTHASPCVTGNDEHHRSRRGRCAHPG
jgi:hypothetical protein